MAKVNADLILHQSYTQQVYICGFYVSKFPNKLAADYWGKRLSITPYQAMTLYTHHSSTEKLADHPSNLHTAQSHLIKIDTGECRISPVSVFIIFWLLQKAFWFKYHLWHHHGWLPSLPMQYTASTHKMQLNTQIPGCIYRIRSEKYIYIYIFCPTDPLNLETILRTTEHWEKDHFGSAFLPHLPLQLLLCANAQRPVQLISWGHNEPTRADFLAQRC